LPSAEEVEEIEGAEEIEEVEVEVAVEEVARCWFRGLIPDGWVCPDIFFFHMVWWMPPVALLATWSVCFCVLWFLAGRPPGGKTKKDAPLPYQLTFQDPATPGMEGIIDLHHEIMFYVIIVITFVFWMTARIVVLFNVSSPALPYSAVREHLGLEWL
jgi:hypothetical protein